MLEQQRQGHAAARGRLARAILPWCERLSRVGARFYGPDGKIAGSTLERTRRRLFLALGVSPLPRERHRARAFGTSGPRLVHRMTLCCRIFEKRMPGPTMRVVARSYKAPGTECEKDATQNIRSINPTSRRAIKRAPKERVAKWTSSSLSVKPLNINPRMV